MPAPDVLALHARSQPEKIALIDDRPGGRWCSSPSGS